MKNKFLKCFVIIMVFIMNFVGMVFCDNVKAVETKDIQTIDNVTLSENRIVLDTRDATNVDISVSGINGYDIRKNIRGEKCGQADWSTGKICPFFRFTSKTAHLVSLPNRDLRSAVITIIYDKVGTYNGQEIGAKLTVSIINIYNTSGDNSNDKHYFQVSDKFYDGYAFLNLESFRTNYEFFYTSDSSKSPISLKNAYLTVNSCNYYLNDGRGLGDESVYFDSEQLSHINKVLVRRDSNMTRSNNLHHRYAFGVTPTSNDFTDLLGGETFEKNSVTFEVTGSFGCYFDSNSEKQPFAWRTLSSAMISKTDEVPKPKNPEKSIADANNHESTDVYYKSGEEYTFVIRQTVHELGVNILTRYKSFVMKDVLPKQVEYIDAKMYDKDNNLVNDGTVNYDTSNHTVTWTANNNFLNTMPLEGETYALKIKVKIKNGINEEFTNKGTTIINNTTVDSNVVTLHTPTKEYASDTPSGKNGAVVKEGDKIKYSIKYGNASAQQATITIKDTISKGLSYVDNSAKIGDTSLNPTVTKNSDGSTTLVWTKEVNASVNEELTYTVLVTGDVDKVHNKASIKYADGTEIELPELSNPLQSGSIIDIPDTASTIAIIGVIAGLALVGGGGYLIYKKYKKA